MDLAYILHTEKIIIKLKEKKNRERVLFAQDL